MIPLDDIVSIIILSFSVLIAAHNIAGAISISYRVFCTNILLNWSGLELRRQIITEETIKLYFIIIMSQIDRQKRQLEC
jgi:hypothetical protein